MTYDETKHTRGGNPANTGEYSQKTNSAPEGDILAAAGPATILAEIFDGDTTSRVDFSTVDRSDPRLRAQVKCDDCGWVSLPVHVADSDPFLERARDDHNAKCAIVREHVDEFLMGGIGDLTTDQTETIAALSSHMNGKPEVVVHDFSRVDLIYSAHFGSPGLTLDDGTTTARLTLDQGGHVVAAGQGEDWDEDDWDAPILTTLRLGGFADAGRRAG